MIQGSVLPWRWRYKGGVSDKRSFGIAAIFGGSEESFLSTIERLALVLSDMAANAKSDQILLGIFSRVTAKVFVVNLKIGHRATQLASPAIPPKHLVEKLVVQFGIQAQT